MRLGPYEVKNELGRGTGGVVYRVVAPSGAELALKLLPRKAGRDGARLLRELELMRSLGERSGFVPLLDAGSCPEGSFLVMPLLRGGTLRERLARERLAPGAVAEIGIALARTIGRAHAAGIVHRDLKPENVLFDVQGAPYVADLGVAKLLVGDTTPMGDLSRTGEVRGTPGYMPLEQLHDAKRAGPTADVFAIGAILYECLVGRPPFLRETIFATIDALEAGSFEPLAKARPDVPRPLARVIERALATQLAQRFADGASLAHALEDAAAARPQGRPVARIVGGVVLALAALALGVALALAGSSRGPPPSPEGAPSTSPRPSPPAPVSCASPTPSPSPSPAGDKLVVTGLLGSASFRLSSAPTALAVSADGRVAIVGDVEGHVRWFRLPSGEELYSHIASTSPISAVAPLGDGQRTLILAKGQKPIVVNPETAKMTTLDGHEHEVTVIAAAPVKAIAATADRTGFKIWDLDAKTLVLNVTAASPARALAFGPDGNHLFVGYESGVVGELQIEPKAQLPTVMTLPGPIVTLAVSPEGDRVAAATPGTPPLILQLADRSAQQLLRILDVRSLSFGSSGRLYTATEGGSFGLYELAAHLPGLSTDDVVSVTTPIVVGVPSLGRSLFLSAPVGQPRLSGESLTPGHERWVAAIVPLPGGRLASAGGDHAVRIWELATGEELGVAREHTDGLTSLALSPDGRELLSSGLDGVVHRRDPATGLSRGSVASPIGKRVEAVRYGTDGRSWIATERGIAPATGEGGSPAGVHVVALEPAPGGRLLAWDETGELSLRDERAGTVEWSRKLLPPATRAALVALRGGLVAALEAGGGLRLIRSSDGSEVWPTPATLPVSWSVAASPDGRRLAVGGSDVVLVDAADGAVLSRTPLPTTHDDVTSLAFSLDGRELFAGTARGLIVRVALR